MLCRTTNTCKHMRRAAASPAIRSFSSNTAPDLPGSLVGCDWLARNIPSLKVVSGTWALPKDKTSGHQLFLNQRIPGSVFFDIDAVVNPDSPFAHTHPTADVFAQAVTELGLNTDDTVVVYDHEGMFSSPRVWYTFKTFGFDKVAVLDGGLPSWISNGYPTATGKPARAVPATNVSVKYDSSRWVTQADVLAAIDDPNTIILDARSDDRFDGLAPEPRPGLRGGHIPGSKNLPFTRLQDDFTGALKAPEILRHTFERVGVDPADTSKRIITTCGSGVTAAYVSYALHLLGHDNTALYDGSWTEWGANPDLPIEK